MADGAQPIRPSGRLGLAVAGVIAGAVGACLLAVALAAEPGRGLGSSDWAAIRFTVLQATLSALLSVALAIPVARALARRAFPGRRLLVLLMGAPFILPVIVAVLGLLSIFGLNGLLNRMLGEFGVAPFRIYGLQGVVLAHVFFNLPLAVRLLLHGWLSLPAEQFRLAAALRFGPWASFRHIEWPMLRRIVPGAVLVIFLICTTSFAVALTLGGGPRATTVELAIYQAFRFDFDLQRAAYLALVQLVIAGTATVLALALVGRDSGLTGFDRPVRRWDASRPTARWLDGVAIVGAALFLVMPLASVVLSGAPHIPSLPPSVWEAALRSLGVAALAVVISLGCGLSLAAGSVALRRSAPLSRGIEFAGALGLAVSPLVLGTGAFLMIRPFADPAALALVVTALVNALATLPFVVRAIAPALAETESRFGRLAESLRLSGWTRLRVVVLPRLRRPLAFSAGLAAALSIGDLGVIALFSDPERATLPMEMYRLMGAYRMDQAAGAAVLLLGLSLGAFWALDRGARAHVAS